MNEKTYPGHLVTQGTYGDRQPIKGRIVALLHIVFEERGLNLIEAKSRALCQREIHELMVTDEEEAGPGGGADHVSPIAFFEIVEGGLAVIGDIVSVEGREFGRIVGYDLTHMPNHMNILIKADSIEVPSVRVGEEVVIKETHYSS